jgi:tetratricopeptide (TPR) repeat protein
MADVFTEIRTRRVLPALGVYIGGCWVMVEIFDRLTERYLLSPYITDIAFWGLYSLIPAVLLMAWAHGKPGKDQATTAEKVGVPINLIATVGLLVTVFGGKDLGATADLVTVSNELGEEESHYVARDTHRSRMAAFFWTNKSGDQEHDWLQYGITELLVQDLQQSPFILASSPYNNWGNGYYARMKEAGFNDGLGVPRSLMREIAERANRQYFVEGSFTNDAGEWILTARIWNTQNLELVAELTENNWDLLSAVDQISVDVRAELGVPEGGGRLTEDLPLVETYGESETAMRFYVEGINARLFDNDFDRSNALMQKAIDENPNFVLAWFLKGANLLEGGDVPAAQEAFDAAQKLDYRLPAQDKAQLKAIRYRLNGENEKLLAFLELQVKLNNDAASYTRLAQVQMMTGALEEAKQQYLYALQKDPLDVYVYLQLSSLERATGNIEQAVAYARQYQKARPEEAVAHLRLGDLLMDSGDLEQAAKHFEQAQLLEDQAVTSSLRLAMVAARLGNPEQVRELLEKAESEAGTDADKSAVRSYAAFFEIRLGRPSAAIEQINRQAEFFRQSQPPMTVALGISAPLVAYNILRQDLDSARAALREGLAILQPPLDQFLSFSEASILIASEEFEAAEAAVRKGEEVIAQFGLEALNFEVSAVRGHLQHALGNFPESAVHFQTALEQLDGSVLGAGVRPMIPVVYALLASVLVESGELDDAGKALARGFRLDPSHPHLWLAKARLQSASGQAEMANASLGYAFAIWKDAEPEYRELAEAHELQAELNGILQASR